MPEGGVEPPKRAPSNRSPAVKNCLIFLSLLRLAPLEKTLDKAH